MSKIEGSKHRARHTHGTHIAMERS